MDVLVVVVIAIVPSAVVDAAANVVTKVYINLFHLNVDHMDRKFVIYVHFNLLKFFYSKRIKIKKCVDFPFVFLLL